MKRLWGIFLVLLFMAGHCYAGTTDDRQVFFNEYTPSSKTFVYDSTGSAATGNQVAVNAYSRKTIQINGQRVDEYVVLSVEGRLANSGLWSILDTGQFGAASSDAQKNFAIDVTEYVDFIKVGLKFQGVSAGTTTLVDVKGLFTNIER
jgi:hypothetical protein